MTGHGHECGVEDPVHEGDVREHVTAGTSPYYRPLWLCARHRRYVGYALDRIAVTGEELVRAIAVLSGAGKRRTGKAEPDPEDEPAPPVLRVVSPP
ncbi:hypothetical protein [Streptomyces daliensis]|uniref:Uncharacterized protein n=1 Tax=Streptomyces daliensis TaxID=299421 RepID=A0A8T4IQG0_9ACTN|nr:hypothetical protein [Streptomyces daliensis]